MADTLSQTLSISASRLHARVSDIIGYRCGGLVRNEACGRRLWGCHLLSPDNTLSGLSVRHLPSSALILSTFGNLAGKIWESMFALRSSRGSLFVDPINRFARHPFLICGDGVTHNFSQ